MGKYTHTPTVFYLYLYLLAVQKNAFTFLKGICAFCAFLQFTATFKLLDQILSAWRLYQTSQLDELMSAVPTDARIFMFQV